MTALDYARQLVAFDSRSALTNVPVSECVRDTLSRLGCEIEWIDYEDENGVPKANVIGRLGPEPVESGGMAYFAHTDVVPADNWRFDEHGPFTPTVKEGRLYGRGSCDMKGSVACMLAALEEISAERLTAPVYVVCTADEEVGYGGAERVARQSRFFAEMVEHRARGIIGEPTELEVVHAHKGVCGLVATAHGTAAHSSLGIGENANLKMIPFLAEMKRIHDSTESDPQWQHPEFTPPTMTWNIGINDHTRACNITAPQSVCTVYFRPMPGQDPQPLIDQARVAAERYGLEFEVKVNGGPLYVDRDALIVAEALELAGRSTPHTVPYGTDGCSLSALRDLVVIGPGSIKQAHTFDEWIDLDQLAQGTALYRRMVDRWCCT